MEGGTFVEKLSFPIHLIIELVDLRITVREPLEVSLRDCRPLRLC